MAVQVMIVVFAVRETVTTSPAFRSSRTARTARWEELPLPKMSAFFPETSSDSFVRYRKPS